MEIVIKIQEHDKAVIDRFVNGEGFEVLPTPIVDKVIRAVRNGSPLPKGHGRLIDADALNFNADYNEPLISKLDFDWAPTIIEAEKEREEK